MQPKLLQTLRILLVICRICVEYYIKHVMFNRIIKLMMIQHLKPEKHFWKDRHIYGGPVKWMNEKRY